jgi:hypothetical protein
MGGCSLTLEKIKGPGSTTGAFFVCRNFFLDQL